MSTINCNDLTEYMSKSDAKARVKKVTFHSDSGEKILSVYNTITFHEFSQAVDEWADLHCAVNELGELVYYPYVSCIAPLYIALKYYTDCDIEVFDENRKLRSEVMDMLLAFHQSGEEDRLSQALDCVKRDIEPVVIDVLEERMASQNNLGRYLMRLIRQASNVWTGFYSEHREKVDLMINDLLSDII